MTETEVRRQALEPLTVTLLARAQAGADGERAAAEQEGQRVVAAAASQAEASLAHAQALGEADAAGLLAADRATSRRAARAVVLAAQRAAYDELRHRSRAAVAGLLADPERHHRLAVTVRDRLGEGATVRDHPAGGVMGEAPDGRHIDASVGALVEAALAGIDLGQLWAPQ